MLIHNEILRYVNSYLQGNSQTPATDSNEKTQAQLLAKKLINSISKQKTVDRITILADLSQTLQRSGTNEDINRRRQILKDTLAGAEKANWKSNLLNTRTMQIFSLFYTPLQYDNNAKYEISLNDNRCTIQETEEHNAALMGSNFITSKSVMQHANGSHVLDAIYSAYKITDNRELIVALADGCGGHFRVTPAHFSNPKLSPEEKEKQVTQTNKDFELQDKNIARAAHFATKHAVRLLAAYNNPKESLQNILQTVRDIEQEVKQKAPNEATTLVCARAFATNEGYRIVGFGIGDSMLAAWDPIRKIFTTLIPSVISIPHSNQPATAQIPGQYKDFEVHIIDKLVSPETIILPLSDGYVDYLPQVEQMKIYPNGLAYKEVTLDSSTMQEILTTDLPVDTAPRNCLIRLSELVFSKINEQRIQELHDPERNQEIQLGDDIAGAALVLPAIERAEHKCSVM